MSVIDKLGIVWGCLVAFFLMLIGGLSGPHEPVGAGILYVWAILVIPPWVLLRGLAWAFRDVR